MNIFVNHNSNNKNELVHYLDKLLTEYHTIENGECEYELEIRFGYFYNNFFKTYISYEKYIKLINYFQKSDSFNEKIITNTIDMYNNGIRVIKHGDTTTIVKKTKKNIINIKNIGVRIALSLEEKIKDVPYGDTHYFKTKNRIRNSFIHSSQQFKVDITCDKFYQNIHYQCELEFLRKPTNDEILKIIDKMNYILK